MSDSLYGGLLVAITTTGLIALLLRTYLDLVERRRQMRNEEREFLYRVESERRKESTRSTNPLSGGDEIVSELLRRQTLLLEQLLAKESSVVVNLRNDAAMGGDGWRSDVPAQPIMRQDSETIDGAQLMRELSHSLNTPLSQIEATILTEQAGTGAGGALHEQAFRRIQGSVEICKAFLAAFGALTQVAASASGWNPTSLNENVRHAANVYAAAKGRLDISFDISLDDRIPGYDSAYLVATILPLLENAVEAAAPASEVHVWADREPGRCKLHVENVSEEPPDSLEVFRPGFTTKGGHQGLGLSVVQGLVKHKGGTLSMDCDDAVVRFTVDLQEVA